MIIVAGNMLGSGIYLLPATLGAIGSITLVGWGLSLAAALLLSLLFSMLAIRRPGDAGMVGYIAGTMGKMTGFQAGYIYWISIVVGNGAIALAAASYAVRLMPIEHADWAIAWVAILLILACTLANLGGARLIAGFGGVSLAIGLAPVALIIAIGVVSFDPQLFRESWNVSGQAPAAAVTFSLPSIAWAFLGLESAGAAALVVRDPRRNVPIATIGGVLIAGIIYTCMSATLFGLAPASVLANSSAPIADVVARYWGNWVALAVAGCAAVKATGTLAGWTLVGAETAVSGSKSGLLPGFGRDSESLLRLYLILGAAVMAGTIFLSRSASIGAQFGLLINSTTILCLIVYACCGIVLIRLGRNSRNRREHRLAIAVGLSSIAICIGLILAGGLVLIAVSAVVLASGIILAVGFRRLRAPPSLSRDRSDPEASTLL